MFHFRHLRNEDTFLPCLDQTSRELNDWALKKQSQGQDSPMSITFYFRFIPVSRCLSTIFRDRNFESSRTDPKRIRFQDVFFNFLLEAKQKY